MIDFKTSEAQIRTFSPFKPLKESIRVSTILT